MTTVTARAQHVAAGRTTPARLLRVGIVLVVGGLLAAAVSVASAAGRADGVDDARARVAALAADAAGLHQALADADATATAAFVTGGGEVPADAARYDADVDRAAQLVVAAAGRLPDGDPALPDVGVVAEQLPAYTELIETARTYDRQGLPLGQAYLTAGSRLMRETILPAVTRLRAAQDAGLTTALDRGGAVPVAVLVLGVALLVALVDVGRGERRRTRRDLSPGLAAAALAVLLALLWWVVASVATGSALGAAQRHATAAAALDEARVAVAQARSNESLVLVARGGGSADSGFVTQLDRVLDPGGLLDTAAAQGAGTGPIRAAGEDWRVAHRELRALDDGGRYRDAVASAVGNGSGTGSGTAFRTLDGALGTAVTAERDAFAADVAGADAAQTLLVVGPAALLVLAAAAAGAGVARRVEEYR